MKHQLRSSFLFQVAAAGARAFAGRRMVWKKNRWVSHYLYSQFILHNSSPGMYTCTK